mmetsp:Transcript_1727/g.7525  ORF Transcript_1727/g.7525 Transcript_1727/m.7525 type:complete len:898 (-) Transcript_1727:418-3111(-)
MAEDHTKSSSSTDARLLKKLSDRMNGNLESFYRNLGERVAEQPKLTIFLILLLTGLLGVGWLRLDVEEREDRLFTSQDSEAQDDRDFVDDNFGASVRFVTMFYTGDSSVNFLDSRAAILDMFDFYEDVELNDVVDNGDLRDLCIISESGECAKESVLAFWQYNRTTFLEDDDWVVTMSQVDQEDPFALSGQLEVDNVMGTFERDETGNLTSVRAFRFEWTIEENLVTDGREESDPEAEDFEEDFHDYTKDFDESVDNAAMTSLTTWRYDQVISETFANDGQLTAIAYVILTIYACIVMSSRSKLYSRSVLGLAAVFTVGCSVVSGFGLCFAIGIPFSLVVNSVIFVMLGLGVDDAFVILDALTDIGDTETVIKTKLGRTLARAGASITLTSVTDCAAFLVGSSTIIPALQAFSFFAAVTILFDFFYQVTLFVAFVKFEEDRIARRQADCTCLCAPFCMDKTVVETDAACCTSAPMTQALARDTLMRRCVSKYLPDVILSTPGKVCVLLSAVAILVSGGVGIDALELDFNIDWFVPENTDIGRALQIRDDSFAGRQVPVSFYTGSVDYFALQDRLPAFCDAIRNDREIDDLSVTCWYDEFQEDTGNGGTNAATEEEFYQGILDYVNSEQGSRFEDFIRFSDDNSTILATRIPAELVDTDSGDEDIEQMDSVRDTADDFPELEARAYATSFLFLEGLAIVYEETIRNVLLALAVVFLVSLVFLADISAAVIVLLNISAVDVALLGYIHWLGMHMNTVIAINVLLAIGLTVDYSAHIAHAYMHSAGTRPERAKKALGHIGVSVVNGGITTFVATLPLAFAQSYVFQVFFRCFVLIVLFGLYFGVVVLPVVLSLVGPSVSYAVPEKEDETLALSSVEAGGEHQPLRTTTKVVSPDGTVDGA